jgi:hypothetical protein
VQERVFTFYDYIPFHLASIHPLQHPMKSRIFGDLLVQDGPMYAFDFTTPSEHWRKNKPHIVVPAPKR